MHTKLRIRLPLHLFMALTLSFALLPASSAGAVGEVGWGIESGPPGLNQNYCLEQVTDEVLVVGGVEGLARSMNGGQTWQQVYPGPDADVLIVNDIDFVNESEGWAVGHYIFIGAGTDYAVVLHTTDGGWTWEHQSSWTALWQSAGLGGIDMTDDNRGMACGVGHGFYTFDGGEHWSRWSLSSGDQYNDVAVIEGTTSTSMKAILVGEDGVVRRLSITKDGGPISYAEAIPSTSENLTSVAFSTAPVAVAVGQGEFFGMTADYGDTWVRRTNIGVIDSWLDSYKSIDFLDDSHGWAAGKSHNIVTLKEVSRIAYTGNGGAAWEFETLPTSEGVLYDVSAHSTGEVWACDVQDLLHKATTTLERLAGDNRYLTAIAINQATLPVPQSDYAVIATGKGSPDALSASGLCGAYDAPLLLVGDTLPAGVKAELTRLGVDTVFIVGGTGVVSTAVETALAADFDVERIAGPDRYATSRAVAEEVASHEGADFSKKAFIARGDEFPDALAVAPWAYTQVAPVLLVRPSALPPVTRGAIEGLDIETAYVSGGTGAVGAGVKSEVDACLSANGGTASTRMAGADRYATAAIVAQTGIDEGWGTGSYIGVATGLNYPDALAGGVACGQMFGPLVLTRPTSLSSQAQAAISDNARYDTDVRVFGGTAVVSDGVMDAIEGLY